MHAVTDSKQWTITSYTELDPRLYHDHTPVDTFVSSD